MNKSILVTDKVHPKLISELEGDGYVVDHLPNLTLDKTHEIIDSYFGVIINSKTICDKNLIDKAKTLNFIGRLGSGLEIIDLEYAAIKGIAIMRTPEANCQSVAEHALGMILCLFNKLLMTSFQLKSLEWLREPNRGIELRGKNIGIIGYGHTGAAFARLLEPFGVNLLCYDKYKSGFGDDKVLDKIFNTADIISLHLPLTEETIGYVDNEFIEKCKKPFYLINTARGKNVKTQDLIWALDNGHVLGACLDVFENENPKKYSSFEREMYSDLLNRPNVVCSPHVAGWTYESLERIADSMLRQIRELSQI